MDTALSKLQIRRIVNAGDAAHVRHISGTSGYFRDDEVEVAVELVEEAYQRGSSSGYHFIFAESGSLVAGYCCFGPIPCTIGSFDLYWIAVDRQYRHRGIGRIMLREAEDSVRSMGGRMIYIETSSLPLYEDTRSFYLRNGYIEVSRLTDFYSPGDHKLTYVKKLEY